MSDSPRTAIAVSGEDAFRFTCSCEPRCVNPIHFDVVGGPFGLVASVLRQLYATGHEPNAVYYDTTPHNDIDAEEGIFWVTYDE